MLVEHRQELIYFFTGVRIAPFGQGSSIRVYTNLRAYIDLGFRIELVHFVDNESKNQELVLPEGDINLIDVKRKPHEMNRFSKKLAIRLGFPNEFLLNALFPIRSQVITEVRARYDNHPEAIYHFEYDDYASAALEFPGMHSVWSNHDLSSQRVQLIWQSRDERRESEKTETERKRIITRLRKCEDLIAQHSSLIFNIATHENAEFQMRGYENALLFPMSWPDEKLIPRARRWKEDGKLRLLHLGSVNGLVGYESLTYLIGEVFPLLTEEVLKNMELWVVGTLADAFYCNRILEVAKPYPQIRFFGFVEDIKPIYAQADVQVVGGTKASGLRTRILESMVWGVPVLSTAVMAEGLKGLVNGENIFLARNPQYFAEILTRLVMTETDFDRIARNARELYDKTFSRKHAAEVLRTALNEL